MPIVACYLLGESCASCPKFSSVVSVFFFIFNFFFDLFIGILELGGKNPVFIDRDADITLAAKRTVWGRNMNAGRVTPAVNLGRCVKDGLELIERGNGGVCLLASSS